MALLAEATAPPRPAGSAVSDALLAAAESAEPVELATLEQRAALQIRTDRKYVVHEPAAAELVAQLAGRCRALEIGGRRSFRYETTYFDTPDRTLYLATAHRRPDRYKVRVRTYVDSGLTMLEVKGKDRRRRTVKHRMRLDDPIADELPTVPRRFVIAHRPDAPVDRLAPALTVVFDRITLAGLPDPDAGDDGDSRDAEFRVTIDTHLRFVTPDGRATCLDGLAIVESKSGRRVSAADRWLWARGDRPVPISKYCTSMAVLHPHLPANHWHRTIRTFFRAPSRA